MPTVLQLNREVTTAGRPPSSVPIRSLRQLLSCAALAAYVVFGAPDSAAQTPGDSTTDTRIAQTSNDDPGIPELAGLRGENDASTSPHKYQGSYWGLQAHVGVVYRLDARAGDLPGPMVGLSGRLASIMSVADVQLTLQGSLYDVAVAGEDIGIKRLSAGVEVHLHPMFMQHLKNDDYHFWLAGLYGSLGVDLDITAVDATAIGGDERVEFDVGWHLGAGMDYPITDVQAGWSLWLGVSYKLRFLSVDTGIQDFDNFHEHTFIVTLGYRNNDIFNARLPQPSEFDYRDPALPEP